MRTSRFPMNTPAALPVLTETDGLAAMPWHLARTEEDGTCLVIVIRIRPGVRTVGVTIVETATTVTVTVWGTRPPDTSAHTTQRRHQGASVLLTDFLGDRELISPH
jgi:hypothetical protein